MPQPAGARSAARFLLGVAASVLVVTGVSAADHAAHAPAGKSPDAMQKMWRTSLARQPLAATGYFDSHGTFWLATVKEGHITLARSDDKGRTYATPVRVNTEPEIIAAEGENRPKIAVDAERNLFVSWTRLTPDAPFSGHIRFSRSHDGGKTFATPVTINDNLEPISHRFEALGVNARGEIWLAWLDKRDASAARQQDKPYTGAAVYYAVSRDGGKSFGNNLRAAGHSCECCRVAMDMDTSGVPVILWRHVYDKNVRDHAILRLDGKSPPQRVSEDNWAIDACPHHGPALSIDADNTWHVVWFTNALLRHGLFYAHSRDAGKTFSAPMGFGQYDAQAGHAHVLSMAGSVYIVWKEFDGTTSSIPLIRSDDGGKHWSSPRVIATTQGASDHPLLIQDGRDFYLSWNTLKDGYRLVSAGNAGAEK
jgi:hypothetical protein